MHLASYLLISLTLLLSQSCKVQQDKNTTTNKATEVKSQSSDQVEENKKTFPIAEYTEQKNLGAYSQAIFAGGCFWCTEAAFERIGGVQDVISGYSGGHLAYPSYSGVGAGNTGHAEAIFIYYDPEVIDYATLLDVFFVAHDPTTLNRQGPDVGEEYRSAIYFQTEEEQKIIDAKIKSLNDSDKLSGKIVTEVAADNCK